ncbi:MAG: D-2-hydroxyacid dehydrogenase [Chloroflexia bacterium]
MVPAHQNPGQLQNDNKGAEPSHHFIVLLNLSLEPELTEQIASVDPRIQVFSTYKAARLGSDEEPKRVEGPELDALLAQAEVLFSFGIPPEWLSKAPALRWVQLASAGSDQAFRTGIFRERPDLIVTTASGLHEVPISEHIVAMILHFSRGFHRAVRNQPMHKWERFSLDEAHGKTVCLIGYGPIARRAAGLCAALGMRVLAVRGSLLEQQPGQDGVERFYPPSYLDEALAESDYVVVAAPRTPQSEGMIGTRQFEAMKPGAVLINISRGALVDEEALVQALRSGKLAGAGLDVFTQEPLPESSPLWDLPNVLITPHNSGSNPHYNRRATNIFCDNLARFLRGEPMRNQVIAERGY